MVHRDQSRLSNHHDEAFSPVARTFGCPGSVWGRTQQCVLVVIRGRRHALATVRSSTTTWPPTRQSGDIQRVKLGGRVDRKGDIQRVKLGGRVDRKGVMFRIITTWIGSTSTTHWLIRHKCRSMSNRRRSDGLCFRSDNKPLSFV